MSNEVKNHHAGTERRRSPFARAMDLAKTHERRLSSGMFVFGFFADALTLPRVDVGITYVIMGAYLTIAMIGIAGIVAVDAGRITNERLRRGFIFIPPIVQLVFGALFSALFVYYSRSGSIVGSWPFLALVVLAILGNELLHDRFKRLEFRLASLFFVLYMTMTFAVPIALRELGVVPFLLAGVLSLLVFACFSMLLYALAPLLVAKLRRPVGLSVLAITVLLNTLYVTHVIPPIPLVLRDAEAYLTLVRQDVGGYLATTERQRFAARLGVASPRYHVEPGGAVTFFTSVFAPTKLSIGIVHEWQYKDPESGDWQTESTIMFPISGGRDGGYRGYTTKEHIREGVWRVNVRTERGEILGREVFEVVVDGGAAVPVTVTL